MAEEDCCTTQLIDGNGEFNVSGLDNFTRAVKLSELGLSYAVVAIMGPQSSGKSTLLNHLFHTNFREMDAFRGRSQTTKGIWIARAVGIVPCTVIMDLEGTDGRERGEDDTAFEKQSALFALAVSDIVVINMWCHDIGREQAASRPLLKAVFQVMMRLFSPRKTTLLFVIRDKTKTPLEYLEPVLREDIQKIWDTVSKPQAHKDMPLREFFNVEVTALSSYEEKENQFKEQLPGLLSITSRFLPTVMNLLRRLAEEAGGHPQAHEEPRRPQYVGSHSFRNQTHQPNSVSGSVPASSVASTVSSTESGTEYSSPQLTRRRVNNVEQVELS